jgi:hypothetical protein
MKGVRAKGEQRMKDILMCFCAAIDESDTVGADGEGVGDVEVDFVGGMRLVGDKVQQRGQSSINKN